PAGCTLFPYTTLFRSRIVINEDISGFFPSTSAEHVFNIWHELFGCSQEVSQCLTQLTTRRGELPQGAITSSFLANLVFWQDEPRSEEHTSELQSRENL